MVRAPAWVASLLAAALLLVACTSQSVSEDAIADGDPEDEGDVTSEVVVDTQPDDGLNGQAATTTEPDLRLSDVFDTSEFELMTACVGDNFDAEVREPVEVADYGAVTDANGWTAELSVKEVGQLASGAVVIRTDCVQVAGSSTTSATIEVFDLDESGDVRQSTVTVRNEWEAGPLRDLRIDGGDLTFTLIERERWASDGQLVRKRSMLTNGTWEVVAEDEARRVLLGPAFEVALTPGSALEWDYVDGCIGRISHRSETGNTMVYLSGAGLDGSRIARLRGEGAQDLVQVPNGSVEAVRFLGEGFDAVAQPAVVEEVIVVDDQGRSFALVAIDGETTAVLDEILAGLTLVGAGDDVFDRSGRCEPSDHVG